MRSQVSVFIIFGLILLVVVGLATYVMKIGNEVSPVDMSQGAGGLESYVMECIDQVALPSVMDIGIGGGTIKPEKHRWYFGKQYNYLCSSVGGICLQKPLLRQDMEAEIEQGVLLNITRCVDLDIFRRQDFEVQAGTPSVNVTIGRYEVDVGLSYPIRLVRGDVDITVKSYHTRIEKPLGLFYDKSIEIINSENSQGHFDSVDYMYRNSGRIIIEKHRPYPDTVYSLTSDDYTFMFAMEGVTAIGASIGCCYNLYDKSCFKNVAPEICESKGGIYDMNFNCECPEVSDENDFSCNGGSCRDCEKTFDYVTGTFSNELRKHGESWCEYDSVAVLMARNM
jgi:hypothetical protein